MPKERPMNPTWVETQELLTATFERPAGDRERFVREHFVDPALRDTIAALVTPFVGAGLAAATPDGQPDLPSGSHVGPYIVLHRLGRGGMGEVFLGRDPRLDRSVALKCLLTSRGCSEELRVSVIREARAAARIAHAHVAAVYDVVEHDGRTFIVMEYVEGESLAALLRREPLSSDRVVALGRQIAAALAAAHRGGIVHRDLKPANIQVTPDGSIKILDFGIAKALARLATGPPQTILSTITSAAELQPGTPAYMSPEQLLGRPIDERSDLFSLAIVLFEMATGRRPVQSLDPLEILLADVRTLPRADSFGRLIPQALADVIAKGLAADPRDRFQSALEMEAALEAVHHELFPAPVRDHPRSRVDELSWPRRIGWAAAALVLIPGTLWFLGRINSAAFNATLGRSGAFAWEPAWAYVVWGSRSLVAPCVYAALATIALWAIRFVLRLIALSAPIARRLDGLMGRLRAVARRLTLEDPIVSAQGLAMLGVVALAVVAWRFNGLIRAWGANISTAQPGQLWPLGAENESEKVLYRVVLTVLFVAFGAGLVRVLQLRARLGTRGGIGPVAALVAIVASLLLLNEVPYRILWKSAALRVDYRGSRCYAIGEDPGRWLLYCPDGSPPRNRVVDRIDPDVRTTGVTESIFTPLE
jgi:serine/threonine protein kinase